MSRKSNYKRRKEIQNAIFWIGLGILWLTDSWWPGILILVGISMLMSTVIASSTRQTSPKAPVIENPISPASPLVKAPAPPSQQKTPGANPKPEAKITLNWLPETCDACGAPIAADEVYLDADKNAICPYCDHVITKP